MARIYYEAERAWLGECYPKGFPAAWFPFDSASDAVEQMGRYFSAIGPVARYLVAETGGVVGGWALAGRAQDGGADGQVYALYVEPARWRSGVGRALAAAAEGWLITEGFARAHLWAVETNPRARAFYDALGWVHDGTIDRSSEHPPLARYVRTF